MSPAFRMPRPLGQFVRFATDLVLPPVCVRCGAPVEGDGGVCSACWESLSFLSGRRVCRVCAEPIEDRYGLHDGKCGHCRRNPPSYGQARAALLYDDAARDLVLGVKYGDRLHTIPILARLMVAAGREVIADADCLVPVPVHPSRLRARRFNQSAELARACAKLMGVPVDHALVRTRATPSQSGGRMRRRRNVAAAFSVPNPDRIRAKHAVLIDDVLTTGATVEACAQALMMAGAKRVDVLALARAAGPDEADRDGANRATRLP